LGAAPQFGLDFLVILWGVDYDGNAGAGLEVHWYVIKKDQH
jgi:hypothetical protein